MAMDIINGGGFQWSLQQMIYFFLSVGIVPENTPVQIFPNRAEEYLNHTLGSSLGPMPEHLPELSTISVRLTLI